MKEKIINLLVPLSWFFILLFCVFLFSFTSHAASDQDYFPMFQNHNNKFTSDVINKIETYFDSTNNYIFCRWDSYTYNRNNIYVLVWSKSSGVMLYGEKYSNLQQFSLYTVGGSIPLSTSYKIEIPNNASYINVYQNFNLSTYGGYSSNYSSTTDYISNFQLMTNNTSSAQVVLFYDDGISVPDGDTAREDMEMPDIDDYVPTWTNPPTFDNSTVESSLSSLNDTVKWLGSNIKNTIDGGFKFIGDTVRWSLQKVLDRITDTAQSLLSGIQSKINDVITSIGNKLEDIKDFFSNNGIVGQIKTALTDIKDGITYLTQPLDSNIVNLAFHNTNFYTLADDYVDLFEDFHDAFDIAEPDSFTLTINVQNIRTFYNFGVRNAVVIHLDQNFIPIRQALRSFLWILVSFGAIFVVDKGLANWLRGERNQ